MSLNYYGHLVEMESVSNVTATNSVDLGTVRTFAGEDYVYVYNAGADQISLGHLAVMSANTGYSVTASSVTGYDFAIGFCKHNTITTGAYGWLLTRGFTNVKNAMASTGLSQGDILVVAAAGAVQAGNVSTTALCGLTGGIGGFYPIGTVLQATGSAGTAYAFVRCFGT